MDSPTRTIWPRSGVDPRAGVEVIDQRRLPHVLEILPLNTVEEFAVAISDMAVRGAGLIGVTAGFGMAVGIRDARLEHYAADVKEAADRLVGTRPTASNLAWAVKRVLSVVEGLAQDDAVERAWVEALEIWNEDVELCRSIGEHGLGLIRKIHESNPDRAVKVLTHCNAGWLAFVEHGSATAPIYAAHRAGIPIEVWVDETGPRNQGASLTAWELGQAGVPHYILADNAGGHLMQHGEVDLVIVGADRITRRGDAANKIGTYLKALAAMDNGVPFVVAFPSSTYDSETDDGVAEIPIEERSQDEVLWTEGIDAQGEIRKVRKSPQGSPARNPAFDVTPCWLIDHLICEEGVFTPSTWRERNEG